MRMDVTADLRAALAYLGHQQPWGRAWEWIALELRDL
jgi:hypothetical protein